MKCLGMFICSAVFFSCSNSFINHELKYEMLGDCKDIAKDIKMKSNINGERYEFLCCMDDGFDGKTYTVERQGDSILVNFPKTASKKQVLYNLVLDIDAKPVYHYIVLDGQGIAITTIAVPKN